MKPSLMIAALSLTLGLGACAPEDSAQGGTRVAPQQAVPAEGAPAAGPTEAPARFAVALDTSEGEIIIDVERSWAPEGADRFYALVREGFFTDLAFFRVIDGFMAQTGIHGQPAVAAQWRERNIPDDAVRESNTKGMVSFATAGPNTRTTQFFINLVDNSRLDAMGFSPFGKVRDMAPVERLFSGYGEGAPRGRGPDQARIQREGNAYLQADFPELDYIRSARVLD